MALPQRLPLAFQQVAHGLYNLAYAFLAVAVLVGGKGGVGVKRPLQAVAGCAQVQDGLLVTGKLLRRGTGQRIGAEQAAPGSVGIGIDLRRVAVVGAGRVRFQSVLPQQHAVSMCVINAQRKTS